MKNITLENILNYLAIAVAVASAIRIGLHWLRQPLKIWVGSAAFWSFYDKLEETVAYVALSLGKFARKGDEEKLVLVPDTKEALNTALETVGDSGKEAT